MNTSVRACPTKRHPEEQVPVEKSALLESLKAHYAGLREVRRGVCLLHAGRFEEAAECYRLAAARSGDAGSALRQHLSNHQAGVSHTVASQSGAAGDSFEVSPYTVAVVRQALALQSSGRAEEGVAVLRDAVGRDAECAELHFQLGTLLASLGCHEEAELRFTQALNIDRHFTAAEISLALCLGVRGAAGDALSHLQRLQRRSPADARIGLLLAQAARAAREQGRVGGVRAAMPEEADGVDARGIEALSRVIAGEPDFVDAMLAIPSGEVDEAVYVMLLKTLVMALERQPEQAELHFHCGQVLRRLGRERDAIAEAERAVSINPRYLRALIALGELYARTDRCADAVTRLEQAVREGAEYADVYYLLGNLYRGEGQLERARGAYRRALTINESYEAAQRALATLPA